MPNIIYCPKPKSQVHMLSANDTSASLPTPDCAADFATSVTLRALHSMLLVQLNVAVVWKMGPMS